MENEQKKHLENWLLQSMFHSFIKWAVNFLYIFCAIFIHVYIIFHTAYKLNVNIKVNNNMGDYLWTGKFRCFCDFLIRRISYIWELQFQMSAFNKSEIILSRCSLFGNNSEWIKGKICAINKFNLSNLFEF